MVRRWPSRLRGRLWCRRHPQQRGADQLVEPLRMHWRMPGPDRLMQPQQIRSSDHPVRTAGVGEQHLRLAIEDDDTVGEPVENAECCMLLAR